MLQQGRVNIQCPCGKLLKTQMVTENTRTRGQLLCTACKKRVEFSVIAFECYTNYK